MIINCRLSIRNRPVLHTARNVAQDRAMTSNSSGASVVQRFYQLLNDKNIDAWGDLWHQSAQIVVLYPAEGFPSLIDGKEAIVAGFRDLIGIYESFQATLTGLYPAADSDAVCVEYSARAVLVDGGEYTLTTTSPCSDSKASSSANIATTSTPGDFRSSSTRWQHAARR
jgi:ketosteroid isomerase-like protein